MVKKKASYLLTFLGNGSKESNCPTTSLNENNLRTTKILHAMKQILFDMGHLTVGRWLFQRALKFQFPI